MKKESRGDDEKRDEHHFLTSFGGQTGEVVIEGLPSLKWKG